MTKKIAALWIERSNYTALSAKAHLRFTDKKALFEKIVAQDPFGHFLNNIGAELARNLDQAFPRPETTFLFHIGKEYAGQIAQFAADWMRKWHRKVSFLKTDEEIFSSDLSQVVSILALPPDEIISAASRHLIERTSYRIALECPYGVNPDNGIANENPLKATQTIGLGRWLIGACIEAGPDFAGEQILIGEALIPATIAADFSPKIWQNSPALWQLPAVSDSDQKYCRGGVCICGGAKMMGAARMAALAARSAGAGLSWIWAKEQANLYRLGAPGEIICDSSLEEALETIASKVWICGPGLAPEEAQKILPLLLGKDKIILVDAGGLSYAENHPALLKGTSVLTPHEGEFRKVFGDFKESERLEAVHQAAQKVNAVVLLKGEMTCIAHPDGKIAINQHATPSLATAGSGDILSGVIGAFLAAGLSPWQAASAGAWVHGEAGLRAAKNKGGWPIAEDLIKYLGEARQAVSYR